MTAKLPCGLVLVFILAFMLRAGFLELRNPMWAGDSEDYLRLAQNWVTAGTLSLDSERPLTPSTRRPPVYPFLLGLLGPENRVTAGHAVALVQATLDSCVAVLVTLLALPVGGSRLALAAGLFYAVHPGAIVMSSAVLSEAVFASLLTLGIAALARGMLLNRLLLTAAAGLALGLASLTRPVGLVVPFASAVICCARLRGRGFVHAGALLICTLFVVTPWVVRSSKVAGQLVVIQGGSSAAAVYLPTLTSWDLRDEASVWPRFFASDEYGRRLAAARTPRELAEADAVGWRLAWYNIQQDWRTYVVARLSAMPYLVFTSHDHFTGLRSSFSEALRNHDAGTFFVKAVMLVVFSVVPMTLAIIGLIGCRRDHGTALAGTAWISGVIVHLATWIEPRYWQPFVPFLLVSAAVGARAIGRWAGGRGLTCGPQVASCRIPSTPPRVSRRLD